MNLCTTCGLDFGSVSAFDRHRVGTHEYTLWEGLRRDPPQDNGRRCLDISEMQEIRDKDGELIFAKNERGDWSLLKALESARRLSR